MGHKNGIPVLPWLCCLFYMHPVCAVIKETWNSLFVFCFAHEMARIHLFTAAYMCPKIFVVPVHGLSFPWPHMFSTISSTRWIGHPRKWKNHGILVSWLFKAASLWACSSRNTCQAIFLPPGNTLRCLICGLCWKTVVSGSTTAPVRLFSLKPSAEDVPHNAFGTHKSQGGKRFKSSSPRLQTLFINPRSHW